MSPWDPGIFIVHTLEMGKWTGIVVLCGEKWDAVGSQSGQLKDAGNAVEAQPNSGLRKCC
jgi:hypothetical protein